MEITVNIDTIILYVQDVDRLKSFYINNFNLKIVEEYQSLWTLLEAGGCNIGLHKIGEQYLKKIKADLKFHNNTKVVFEIYEDIKKVRTYFVGQNVIMREIKTFDKYDYWLCDGKDPEGNVFQLKQKKQI